MVPDFPENFERFKRVPQRGHARLRADAVGDLMGEVEVALERMRELEVDAWNLSRDWGKLSGSALSSLIKEKPGSWSTRSWISQNYPDYVFEQRFEEEDTLWAADRYQTNDEHVARKQRLLEDIFPHDDSTFISLTTHSYAISAILEAVGARTIA
ncbi:hypothetical protein B0H63DRAFT_557332 [Podospora didyma]|uniref:Phosphoglycerate mutase n=1 Tax=Podospora didyma TaxID=330526 RepID=A0AAE0NZ41_9PEZI|nr:hypothetical protein B0H63DRAFT_557332 [Podospora didyma]